MEDLYPSLGPTGHALSHQPRGFSPGVLAPRTVQPLCSVLILMSFGTSSPKTSQALLGIPLRRENELGLCARLIWSRGEGHSWIYALGWSGPEVRGTAGSFLPSRISFQSQGEDKGPNSEFINSCVEGGKWRGDSESYAVPQYCGKGFPHPL